MNCVSTSSILPTNNSSLVSHSAAEPKKPKKENKPRKKATDDLVASTKAELVHEDFPGYSSTKRPLIPGSDDSEDYVETVVFKFPVSQHGRPAKFERKPQPKPSDGCQNHFPSWRGKPPPGVDLNTWNLKYNEANSMFFVNCGVEDEKRVAICRAARELGFTRDLACELCITLRLVTGPDGSIITDVKDFVDHNANE